MRDGDQCSADPSEPEATVEDVRVALIRAFGATRFDVWLGKDGLEQHDAAAIAVVAARAVLAAGFAVSRQP